MAKKLINNVPAQVLSEPEIISIDIGYRFTKATRGDRMIMFPSVLSRAHDIRYKKDEISAKHPGMWVTDDQEDWFVGDLAIQQGKHQLQLQGRDGNTEFNTQFRVRMMLSALAQLYPNQRNGALIRIMIVTGLPVDHLADAAALTEALSVTRPVDTNNTGFNVEVIEVMIMPQPYGTMYGEMFTAEGELNEMLSISRAAVTDIGGFTIDCILDEDGDYIDAESGSEEAGVFIVQEALAAKYEAKFGSKATLQQIDQLLRTGKLNISGEDEDFSDWLEDALKPLVDITLSLMGRLWDKALDVQRIYVTGGGAKLIFKYIKARYKQAVLVENAQMANAIGYRNYARYLANNPE